MKLKDKIIVVTGGSTGIGLEISKQLASENATVIIVSRNQNNLISALKEISNINKNSYYFKADVSNREDVKLLHNWLKRKFVEIHGLINCHGVYGPIGNINNIKYEDFIDTFNINFMGVFNTCQILIPLFSVKNRKKIVNLSGGGAATPFPNYSAYSISKVAIVRFTENLAIELKNDNFDINCIGPGFVATNLHQKTIDAGPELVGEDFYNNTINQLKTRTISPEHAAKLSSFLMSDESDFITGKFLSAPWDNWNDAEFIDKLKNEKDFATLRRIDNKLYFKNED